MKENKGMEVGSVRGNYGRVSGLSRVIEEKLSKDRWVLGEMWREIVGKIWV